MRYKVVMKNPFGKDVRTIGTVGIALQPQAALDVAAEMMRVYPDMTVTLEPVYPGHFIN